MTNFSIIVAVSENNGIGKDGKLPWNVPEDMEFFKKITTTVINPEKSNIIIMGRKTFESIGKKPLKQRFNICVSKTLCKEDYKKYTNVEIVDSFEEALELSVELSGTICEKVFVIGGLQLYNVALCHKRCYEIICNEIKGNYDCDTFFPKINMDIYDKPEITIISNIVVSKNFKKIFYEDT